MVGMSAVKVFYYFVQMKPVLTIILLLLSKVLFAQGYNEDSTLKAEIISLKETKTLLSAMIPRLDSQLRERDSIIASIRKRYLEIVKDTAQVHEKINELRKTEGAEVLLAQYVAKQNEARVLCVEINTFLPELATRKELILNEKKRALELIEELEMQIRRLEEEIVRIKTKSQ